MTPEQAKKLLPWMQALAEGKQIQERSKGFEKWSKFAEGDLLSPAFEYRIKPESLKAWFVFYGRENDSVSLFREPPPQWALMGAIAIKEITVEEGEGL